MLNNRAGFQLFSIGWRCSQTTDEIRVIPIPDVDGTQMRFADAVTHANRCLL
jgi:hypothetical protein